jgi:hypothetical protein
MFGCFNAGRYSRMAISVWARTVRGFGELVDRGSASVFKPGTGLAISAAARTGQQWCIIPELGPAYSSCPKIIIVQSGQVARSIGRCQTCSSPSSIRDPYKLLPSRPWWLAPLVRPSPIRSLRGRRISPAQIFNCLTPKTLNKNGSLAILPQATHRPGDDPVATTAAAALFRRVHTRARAEPAHKRILLPKKTQPIRQQKNCENPPILVHCTCFPQTAAPHSSSRGDHFGKPRDIAG